MIYLYDENQNKISPISKTNDLNNIYILIDYDVRVNLNKANSSRNFKNMNIWEVLNQEVSFKVFKNMKRCRGGDGKYNSNIIIPEIVILELKEKIGIFKLLTLKNEVYILEEFFSNMSLKTENTIIFKSKNEFKIFKQKEMHKIDNIYKFPKYKLWQYNDDYEIIFLKK